jgi:hypothetical protein
MIARYQWILSPDRLVNKVNLAQGDLLLVDRDDNIFFRKKIDFGRPLTHALIPFLRAIDNKDDEGRAAR